MYTRIPRVCKGVPVTSAAFLSLLLFSAFFACPTLAQEAPTVDGTGRSIAPGTSASQQTPPLEHRSILLELDTLRATSLRPSLVDELAPEDSAPTVFVYHGIQGLTVRKALGYYRRLFSAGMQTRWDKSSDTVFEVEQRFARESEAEADLRNGRWWERTWRQSLVPSEGGVPDDPFVVTRGSEIDLFRVGEASFTTEDKIRLGSFSFFFDDERFHERFAQKTLETLVAVASGKTQVLADHLIKTTESEENRVSVGLASEDACVELERVLSGTGRQRSKCYETPHGNLVTGEGWNLSVYPAVSLRLPTRCDPTQTLSNAGVEFDLNLYPGETRQQWARVSLELRTSPSDNAYTAICEFEVLRW